MAVFHILMRALSMILVILLTILLIPHFIRVLIRKKKTCFVFTASLLMTLCHGQTFPHDSYKSSPIQKFFERRPFNDKNFHEKILINMLEENTPTVTKTGFGSLVIAVNTYDVLINNLLQSFSGYALCCIVPTSCPSFVSKKRRRSMYLDILMSLNEWPFLQLKQTVDMYLLFLHITLTEFQLRRVIIPLMLIISCAAEKKENVSKVNHRTGKKRKIDKENMTHTHGDSYNANNEGGGQEPKKRKFNKHDDTPCGPCSIWLQLGSLPTFASLHNSKRMFHPNENAASFSTYFSSNNKQITLREDSCLCQACYLDAHKKR